MVKQSSPIIKEINDKTLWDSFASKNPDTFLQSWSWGEFSKSMNERIWRLGIYSKGHLVAVCLVIKINARRGKFLFAPHGPITILSDINDLKIILSRLLNHLVLLAKQEGCFFIRVAPVIEDNQTNRSLFKTLGFRKAALHMHAERCWILDLSKTEKTLLSNMRKTTRYLVRQKDKVNIIIKKSENIDDLLQFYHIYKQTEKRHGFVAFGKKYLQKEFEVFSQSRGSVLYFAFHGNELLSTAFIITYGRSGFYHHGASISKNTKIPASYILQWEIIKDLKKQGFWFYNFWGISPENKPNHPWQGLTFFKKGFGGFAKQFIPTQDYVITIPYWITWSVETIRRIKRRY